LAATLRIFGQKPRAHPLLVDPHRGRHEGLLRVQHVVGLNVRIDVGGWFGVGAHRVKPLLKVHLNASREETSMKLDSTIAAVVTGGASGLGEATARALAAQGVKVALFDMNEAKGEAVAKEIGGVFCKVNVTSDADVDAGFEKARAAHGQERILVNCAGTGNAIKTASRDKATGEAKHFPLDAFNMIIQINLVGTFRCIAKSAKGMLDLAPLQDGERGAIVNTASVAGEDGQVGQAAYSASKGGVIGMTLPIARDLMNDGIRVNTILPGIFNTPLMNGAPENVKAALAASVPFPKRLGNPEEYAQLALTMITCGYFNGEDVRLDGGIRMAPR
jgi:NAD(P)-dependent dehydrogenase (short-subunit alcohol dehydrogenase family)